MWIRKKKKLCIYCGLEKILPKQLPSYAGEYPHFGNELFSEKNNKMLLEGLELSTFAYPNTAYNYDALTEWATGAT